MAMCIDSTVVSDILGKALHELKFTDLHTFSVAVDFLTISLDFLYLEVVSICCCLFYRC